MVPRKSWQFDVQEGILVILQGNVLRISLAFFDRRSLQLRKNPGKAKIAHGLPFQTFRLGVLCNVSLTVLTAHGWNQISIYKQGAFGKLADTSRNHKPRLWLAVKRLKMLIWLIYNWIVHSIMKSRDFVIFQSRARFFTALSLGLGFQTRGSARILPFATPDYHPELSVICFIAAVTPSSDQFCESFRTLVACQLKGARSNVSV